MKAIQRMVSISLLMCLTIACGPMDLGVNGVLRFSDETREPGFNIRFGVNRDIAKGATLNILVSEPGVTMDQVRSDDSRIISIQAATTIETTTDNESRPTDTRVTVRAHETGIARIHVTLEDGRTDYIEVTVAETTANEMEIYPWHDWVALDTALWSNGLKLLPNTNLTIFGRARGADGKALTGAKSAEWVLDTSGDARIEPSEDSDFAVYKSGTTVSDSGLSFGSSARQALPTIAPIDVSRIELIFPFGQMDTVKAGETIILHTAFFAADGAYVAGVGEQGVVYDTSEDAMVGQPAAEDNHANLDFENTESLSSPTMIRAYKLGRAVNFSSDTIGIHTITARWGGLETSLEIEVLPNPNMNTEAPDPAATTVP